MAAEKKTGLGKGLGALIEMVETTNDNVTELNINSIEPNLGQPRKYFDSEKINELAESIKKHGLIQPLIVSKEENVYRIIAGERRWRASKVAGLTKVPVVIKEVTPKEYMELAIIENIQREDLNPLEEAEAYERLHKEYNMTQDEIAESVSKSRPGVANIMRLLSLAEAVKPLLVDGSMSSGHAKCLLAIKDDKIQKDAADEIIKASLSVRQTEEYIRNLLDGKLGAKKKVARKDKEDGRDVEIKYIENTLREIFNTKVLVKDDNNKGKIEIEYYSQDERERILEILQKKGNI